MKIAVIGTGNVGSALALKWVASGHQITLGVRDKNRFKNMERLSRPDIEVLSIDEAVAQSDVVLLATPAPLAVEIAQQLGPTSGKVIIDAMNIVMGRGPANFDNTADAVLANTETRDVVKCFNTTGANNMQDPVYDGTAIDMFVCGDSIRGKELATQLALDAGFAECYDIGGNDKFHLMEQFAWFWINLAMFQGMGRDIGFKLLRR